MKKIWFEEAWDDFVYWQLQDKKTSKRIFALLKDIERGRFDGIGKPEPLKGELSGFWSRRIDDTNRLVYRVNEGAGEKNGYEKRLVGGDYFAASDSDYDPPESLVTS